MDDNAVQAIRQGLLGRGYVDPALQDPIIDSIEDAWPLAYATLQAFCQATFVRLRAGA
jgi:hypothetical protein